MVDVVPASPIAAVALQWFTKLKYMSKDSFGIILGASVVKKEKFDQLSPDDQKALMDTADALRTRSTRSCGATTRRPTTCCSTGASSWSTPARIGGVGQSRRRDARPFDRAHLQQELCWPRSEPRRTGRAPSSLRRREGLKPVRRRRVEEHARLALHQNRFELHVLGLAAQALVRRCPRGVLRESARSGSLHARGAQRVLARVGVEHEHAAIERGVGAARVGDDVVAEVNRARLRVVARGDRPGRRRPRRDGRGRQSSCRTS